MVPASGGGGGNEKGGVGSSFGSASKGPRGQSIFRVKLIIVHVFHAEAATWDAQLDQASAPMGDGMGTSDGGWDGYS